MRKLNGLFLFWVTGFSVSIRLKYYNNAMLIIQQCFSREVMFNLEMNLTAFGRDSSTLVLVFSGVYHITLFIAFKAIKLLLINICDNEIYVLT